MASLLCSWSVDIQAATKDATKAAESTDPDQSAIEEVVVSAHPLSAEGLSQPTAVLSAEFLARSLAPNLGAILSKAPGIQSASFGEAVGRPVIHGLGGTRVLIMEDRISSMDVSTSSGDHATTIEPYIADQIEVLKGTSTLLYGNSAVGGVIDVHTGRIPHELSDGVTGRVHADFSDNSNQRNIGARLDGSRISLLGMLTASSATQKTMRFLASPNPPS